jgi:hypothetical protein
MSLSRLLVLLLVAGCASTGEYPGAPSEQARACLGWYAALDRAVDQAGVRDAQYARVPGFPHYRLERSLAALRDRAGGSMRAFESYAERLGQLDLDARRYEILNLPAERIDGLPGAGASREGAWRRTEECGRLLRQLDVDRPGHRTALLERVQVPDDYSLAARAAGLYPLTRLLFAAGVRRWENDTLDAFRASAPSPKMVRYAPPPVAVSRETVRAILVRAERIDPLGLPALSGRELAGILALYAPTFEILVAGDADRFGELRWAAGSEVPQVDASELAVYIKATQTRYRGRMLLQLVYTIWFPERPRRGAIDLLAGPLDGLMWRVTLAPDGEPLLYDTIHPCGCYHEFFPTPRARPLPPPGALDEWAFVPQSLPRIGEHERPVVRLASGTHYVEQVSVARGTDSLARYGFRPYDALRSLPLADGLRRSAFGPDGLIAGTERAERFLFWPMGIASAGAMRQWGRHATAFVGRRHFDDADLIERRFELDLGEAP